MKDIPEYFFEEVDSTMDSARELCPQVTGDLFLVRTHHQRTGRGRRGRRWYDLPGNAIMLTIAIRRKGAFDPADGNPGVLALRVGASVAETVETLIPHAGNWGKDGNEMSGEIRVKWPNDILINDRKVAGVLIEADPRWFYVGIGLNTYLPDDGTRNNVNLWQEHLSTEGPVSIRAYADFPGENEVLTILKKKFLHHIHGTEWLPIVRHKLAWRGSVVVVETEKPGTISGTLVNIADDGGLIIDTPSGMVSCYAGTVRKVSER